MSKKIICLKVWNVRLLFQSTSGLLIMLGPTSSMFFLCHKLYLAKHWFDVKGTSKTGPLGAATDRVEVDTRSVRGCPLVIITPWEHRAVKEWSFFWPASCCCTRGLVSLCRFLVRRCDMRGVHGTAPVVSSTVKDRGRKISPKRVSLRRNMTKTVRLPHRYWLNRASNDT